MSNNGIYTAIKLESLALRHALSDSVEPVAK